MRLTLGWLREYLETEAFLEQIVDRLTTLGLVVEEVIHLGKALENFKIAEVLKAERHPQADRLSLCQVTTGQETFSVVCGAANVQQGMKAVFAPVGTVIPATGQALKAATIRGQESYGMLCSAQELKLEEESKGIIEVDATAPLGMSYASYCGLDDPVLDIEITPNRGDCLGVYGIARDLAASGLGRLKPLPTSNVQGEYQSSISVTIASEAQHLCPYFCGRVIQGITNKASPLWMQNRLRAVGVRPISAVVDITNYLAYDIGRPMHVFDAQRLKGNLHVRLARSSEKLRALDEKDYELSPEMLVVADQQAPLSVAGIIGGQDSGCQLETQDVFIESALFEAKNIARTGRKLNVITDSRYRFERGVDAAMVLPALERATQFILEHCGGKASQIVQAGTVPNERKVIAFNPQKIENLTSLRVEDSKKQDYLTKLGFTIDQKGTSWTLQVPSWRHDIEIEADLVEEITRLVGYDAIEACALPLQEKAPLQDETLDQRQSWGWAVRRGLAARGLHEALTWSFLPHDRALLFGGGEDKLILTNPISADLSDMRSSLLPNLIDASQRNRDRGYPFTALFEVGPLFKDITTEGELNSVAGIRSGKMHARHWRHSQRAVDAFDAKADALKVLEICGVRPDKVQVERNTPSWYHPGRSGTLQLGPKTILGYFGELHPQVLEEMDISDKIVGFEIFLDAIPQSRRSKTGVFSSSNLQPVNRDFAFIVDDSVSGETIVRAVYKADPTFIKDVTIFDVYQGDKVRAGKKSIALSVLLEPQQVTLTEQEITAISQKIIQNVAKTTGGELRA